MVCHRVTANIRLEFKVCQVEITVGILGQRLARESTVQRGVQLGIGPTYARESDNSRPMM